METLRIAHVMGEFQPGRGGQARMVGNAAQALAARGHTVDIYSFGPTAPGDGFGTHAVARKDIFSGRFWRMLRNGTYDVIHTHGYSSFAPAKALPAELTQRSARVLTPHYHDTGSYPRALRRAYDLTLGAAVCRAAQQIQVDTEFERDALSRLQGIPAEKFEVIPPSLAPAFSRDARPARPARAEGLFRVLFVGRLAPYKGVDHLIRAVGALRQEGGRPVELTVAGEGEPGARENLEKLAKGAGIVTFTGSLADEELKALYDSAGALALPSNAEAFGIVLLEAMSRGLPVVAARAGGMPLLVHDRENGLLVEYADVAGLTAAIRDLASDANLWQRLSRAGMETAKRYTPEKIATKTEAAYRRVIAG
jgi:glycosyltransferase involved in cell wall biosynthesis